MPSDYEPEKDPGLERDSIQEDLSADELQAAHEWQSMAKTWHDEMVPPWQPPRMQRIRPYLDLQGWFPTVASATALVLVLVMFFQQPPSAERPRAATVAADYSTLPPLPQATQAAMVETVLESSRGERQQELELLIKILKAEMDKRTLETEESLHYVIAHQIQGQRDLEDLYQQVDALATGGVTQ